MQNQEEAIRQKADFKKILDFCALAKRHGFIYGWADICCIVGFTGYATWFLVTKVYS
jgi:hypothetical protein